MVSFTSVDPDGSLLIEVDASVYSVSALLRTCYWYTERAYVLIKRGRPGSYNVHFSPKGDPSALSCIPGEFANSLLDNQLRVELNAETQTVRELIVAKAFAEGNLLEDVQFLSQAPDPVAAGRTWDEMVEQGCS